MPFGQSEDFTSMGHNLAMILNRAGGFLLGILILILYATGIFRDINLFLQVFSVILLIIFLAKGLFERYQFHSHKPVQDPSLPKRKHLLDKAVQKTKNPVLQEAELGTLLLAAAYIIVEAGSSGATPLFAFVYLLFCLLGATISYWPGLAYLGALAVTVEVGSFIACDTKPFSLFYLFIRLSFLLIFGAFFRIVLFSEIHRRRYLFQKKVADHIKKIHDTARQYRLNPATHGKKDTAIEKEKQGLELVSSVDAVKKSLQNLLEISSFGFSPRLHSLLLYLPDAPYFVLNNAVSSSTSLIKTPIPIRRGIFGAIEKNRTPIFLNEIPHTYNPLCYYRFQENISSLAALPIMWEGQLLGIIIADRLEKCPFSEEETRSLNKLSREIVRLMEFERLFIKLLKQKSAHEKFHKVAHEFNRAMGKDQVAKAAITAINDVCDAQFAALTYREDNTNRDVIIAADWAGHNTDHLCGRSLLPDAGLVAKVIKLGHPLPESPILRPQQVIFDPSISLPGLSTAKVLPLRWSNKITGTLVVGNPALPLHSRNTQNMLEVIAGHSAIALAQAILYEQLEKLARTDGLTGLINHRHFQEKLENAFQRASRYNKHLTLAIIDIDHFKRVNDRYGHPAGDRVLHLIAEQLYHESRQTDIVARYGGEEFAIIMEETNWEDARRAAERIRTSVAKQKFSSARETFQCTLSVGIASYPAHAKNKDDIIACSDQALYQAKRLGRDRVVVYDHLPADPKIEPGRRQEMYPPIKRTRPQNKNPQKHDDFH